MSKPRNVYELNNQFIIVEEIVEKDKDEKGYCYFSVKAILLPGIIYEYYKPEIQVKRINNVTSLLGIFEIGDTIGEKYYNEESEWIMPVKKARKFSRKLKRNMKCFYFQNRLSYDLHELFEIR
jgi:hypothetical protein